MEEPFPRLLPCMGPAVITALNVTFGRRVAKSISKDLVGEFVDDVRRRQISRWIRS